MNHAMDGSIVLVACMTQQASSCLRCEAVTNAVTMTSHKTPEAPLDFCQY